jgi:hypothetical protein
MKITRQPGKDLRPFADIELGGVFEYDNVIYMRVDLDVPTVGKHEYNAISLKLGMGAHITPDLRVLPLDAELVIQKAEPKAETSATHDWRQELKKGDEVRFCLDGLVTDVRRVVPGAPIGHVFVRESVREQVFYVGLDQIVKMIRPQ